VELLKKWVVECGTAGRRQHQVNDWTTGCCTSEGVARLEMTTMFDGVGYRYRMLRLSVPRWTLSLTPDVLRNAALSGIPPLAMGLHAQNA
jgi:hypothetical protein